MKLFDKIFLLRVVSDCQKHSHPRNKIIPFDLKHIESLLIRNNYNVQLYDQLVDSSDLSNLLSEIRNFHANIIIISFTTLEIQQVEKLISKHNNANTLFVGVGQGVGNYSEKHKAWLQKHFDLFIPGEPEQVFLSYLSKRLNKDNVQLIQNEIWDNYLKKGPYLVEDLNFLPNIIHKKDEIEKYECLYPIKVNKKLKWGHMMTTRGCPHKCTFCGPFIRKSFGAKIRYRDYDSIMSEIRDLVSVGVNAIDFEDDDFAHSSQHVKEICKRLIDSKIEINWTAHARVEDLDNNLIKLMKESGCSLIRFGIESGTERVIANLKKGQGRNWRQQSQLIFKQLRDAGIATTGMFIIGNPEETVDEIKNTINFAKLLRPDLIQVTFFQAYPGSSYFHNLEEPIRDNITKSEMYHYETVGYNVSHVDNKSLKKLHAKFYKDFILRFDFAYSHFRDYFLFYINNPRIFLKLIFGLIGIQVR